MENPFARESNIRQSWRRRSAAFKARWGASRYQSKLHKAILNLMARGAEDPRTPGIALNLFELWGDSLEPARESYLRSCLAEFSEAEGPILVSGASLMTLVLGAISTGDKHRPIWCLEQNPHWTNVMRGWIRRYGIQGAHVITVPPTVKGGTVRYKIDAKHLPRNISMVLCDGPGASAGSALSTLLTIGSNLAPEFTFLARQIKSDDGALIKRWASRHDATFVLLNKRDGFVKISRHERHQAAGTLQRATYIIDTEAAS